LNIGNSLGAILGGVVIAGGLGYLAPVWVGLLLTIAGILLAMGTFALDRARRRRGIPLPSVTGAFGAIGD
jgi:DHA1 family inner membrane transport protein